MTASSSGSLSMTEGALVNEIYAEVLAGVRFSGWRKYEAHRLAGDEADYGVVVVVLPARGDPCVYLQQVWTSDAQLS